MRHHELVVGQAFRLSQTCPQLETGGTPVLRIVRAKPGYSALFRLIGGDAARASALFRDKSGYSGINRLIPGYSGIKKFPPGKETADKRRYYMEVQSPGSGVGPKRPQARHLCDRPCSSTI